MKSYDAGHTETQTALPDPLASTGLSSFGTFALPASLLSSASAAVFAIVWGFFEMDTKRKELFVLSRQSAFLIAASATALAWWILLQCRRRPGRLWPRLWALMLATVSTTTAVLVFVFPGRPRILALAIASLAAAATLMPRLVKLRPSNRMLQHVAPVSMLMILLVILPSSCALRRAIAGEAERRVERQVQRFRIWTAEVNEITSFNWSRMEDSPDAAAKEVEQLRQLKFEGAPSDAELWRAATILGKDAELASAMQALTEAVVAGLAPERVPKVSDLKEAAVRWDPVQRRWEPYTQFPRLSEVTGSYHQELGRLFSELALQDTSAEYAKLVDYREHYAAQREVLQGHLNASAATWADNWAVFKVPQHGELIGREHAPLDDLLRTPFLSSYTPGNLVQLTALPLYNVRQLACEPNRARACRCQNFDEDMYEYFRLDCYSYTPSPKGTGADLRVEMRLVYRSALLERLDDRKGPAEVYFHFLIPEGVGIDDFREKVMTDLAAAARQSLQNGIIRSTDRGGSVAGGFNIIADGTSVRVNRPSVVSLNGLEPEQRALKVRVERAPEAESAYGRTLR